VQTTLTKVRSDFPQPVGGIICEISQRALLSNYLPILTFDPTVRVTATVFNTLNHKQINDMTS
jgi:hypothetical protein